MTRKRTSEKEIVVSGAGAAVPVRRKAAARPRAQRAVEPQTLAAAPQADAVATVPNYQDIAALAYSFWEARGCQGGSPEEDWLRAEQELLAKSSFATA
jgi:hypothetical protein